MWEPFNVCLEPQPLHDGISFGTHHWSMIFSWLFKSGTTSVVVTAWWGLQHIPINCIECLPITFYKVWTGWWNHSMWDESLNNCMMVSFGNQQWSIIFSWLSKSSPTSVLVRAWWGLHIPIHCIECLSITLYMFGMDMGIIQCGMRASATAWWYHLTPSVIQLTFQIQSHKCGGNSMMGAPYLHPLHCI